ncbi:MAG: hypothetical protein QXZ44_03200 [Ferroplasma sp.]
MISRFYYFLSSAIFSILMGIILSLAYHNFFTYFLIYTMIMFIITVSITIFPYLYFNHLMELRIINKIQKYKVNEVINIFDAKYKFNAIMQNHKFNIIKELVLDNYFEAKVIIINSRVEFYQYSFPYVFSYTPFLTINISSIVDIKQKKYTYNLYDFNNIKNLKDDNFYLVTDSESYKMIIEEVPVDKFIQALVISSNKNYSF